MKKRFTRILAAVALLVFMTPSMVAWGQQYMLVKNISELSQGDVILITNAKADGSNYALGTTQNTNNRKAESVSISNETISTLGNAQEITLETKNGDGYFTFQVGTSNYLYAASSSANQLKTRSTEAYWQVTINTTSYVAAVTDMTNSSNRNKMKYNANNGNPIFSCYTSADNNLFVFKKTTGGSTTVSMPTFSPANGTTFEETLQVTLSQADNKDIYYNINSESDPDANSTHYTGPFSINTTSTIKAIAIDGENTSSVATATYTKLVYNNIEDIVANQTQYAVKGTVVAKNSRGFVMGDGTGYVYYYKNSAPTQAIGDYVTISGTTSTYGHILQFPSGASVGTATSSNYDGTPLVAIVDATAMAEYNQDYQLSDYVQYEGNLTKNGNYFDIAVGTAKARISYPTDAQSSTLTNLLNKTVRVKGYFAGIQSYNNESYFTTMLESVEEVVSTDPILSVDPTSLSFTYTQGATEVPSKDFTITGSNLTENVIVTLPAGNFTMYDGNDAITSPLTLIPNEGAINKTITVKMNAGLEQGSYNGTITIAWENEEDITIALTGTVTEPEAPSFTWDLSIASYDEITDPDIVTWSSNYATMTNSSKSGGTSASNYLGGDANHRTSSRFYSGNTLTLSPASGYAITSVEFTATSVNYASELDNSTWTNATASANETTVTVTPIDGNIEMVATIGGTCGFTAVTVYYTQSTLVYYDIELLGVQNGSIASSLNRAQANTTITLTATPNENYYVNDWTILDDEDNAIEWTDLGTDKTQVTFTMPASNVRVEATFATDLTVTTYSLATTIESGKHYIITNGSDKAMGAQTNNNRAAAAVSISNGVASVVGDDVYEFVINGPDANGNYIIYDANELSTGYLYAISGNNYLRTQEFNDATGEWAISFNENKAIIQVTIGETTRIMRFNNSNNVFSCYTSGQQDIYLYVKDNETNYTFYKDVAGFGEADNGNYYLIASPVTVAPANVNNMIAEPAENYDLYSFDQTGGNDGKEWRNFKQGAFTSLVPGTGYLYANSDDVTLSFSGAMGNTTSVNLAKTDNTNADFLGWNLVGNPFGKAAYITKSYYRMNEDGDEVIQGSGAINPMEGVFVIATTNNEQLTFSTTAPAVPEEDLVVNLNSNRGTVVDRAVVRFGQGDQLPKFQLFENSTKIYVTEGNKDYAVVRSAAEAEMPVSFRASENGTYTLAVEAENVEMNYLHLIDNLTGMDVDLLQTPSYTFEAKTSDYASRFRLVFSANSIDEQNAETFAYFNGTNWTVSNVGDATLQVVDLTGRTVANQMINGNAELNLNQPAGVYVIRLVNGDNVKTQKVVVR